MNVFIVRGLPMQPGEPSWASWKCEGGPHTTDFDEPIAARIESKGEERKLIFDADAIVFEAIKLRGNQADRKAYGLES